MNLVVNTLELQNNCRIWEDYLILQMQVFYKSLPEVFDQLEGFIDSIDNLPLSNNQCRIGIKNKHYKLIQEAKCAWLSIYLCMYEHHIQIQQQQHEYICI